MKVLAEETLREIARRLVEVLHPTKVYLFGSHAGGTPDSDSDVDLLVVVPDTDVSQRDLARLGRKSLWGMRIPVDIVVCTTSEMDKWSKASCNLMHTVATKGRLIYASGS